jgi:hypothetical protein
MVGRYRALIIGHLEKLLTFNPLTKDNLDWQNHRLMI